VAKKSSRRCTSDDSESLAVARGAADASFKNCYAACACGAKKRLDPSYTRFKIVLGGSNRFEKRIGLHKVAHHQSPPSVTTESQNIAFGVGEISAGFSCSVATFVENSEPHTGASPSVRLCVGLISPTHKRTEGRAPCGALSLLQKVRFG
jgi:hypothetical protein